MSKPREILAHDELQSWIRKQRRDHIDDARSDSWFINNAQGIQIARDPLIADKNTGELVKSFLNNYAYRNYFHGLQKDLPKNGGETPPPIQSPNLSAVYLSSNSNKMKVAFSVPIWDEPQDDQPPTVLGVLSMSVDLGEFEVLDKYYKDTNKKIVLVDLREDFLEADSTSASDPKQGLILEHPFDNAWDGDGFPRIAPEVLQAMIQNRQGFVPRFYDPLYGKKVPFWGAFMPVENTAKYSATSEKHKTTNGWFVLVESPAVQ